MMTVGCMRQSAQDGGRGRRPWEGWRGEEGRGGEGRGGEGKGRDGREEEIEAQVNGTL